MKKHEKSLTKIFIDMSERDHRIVRLLACADGVPTQEYRVVDEISGKIDVVSSIRLILERNGLGTSDINQVEMNPGPGSFTGLKASAAITNTLNWALGKTTSSEIILPKYQKSKFDEIGH